MTIVRIFPKRGYTDSVSSTVDMERSVYIGFYSNAAGVKRAYVANITGHLIECHHYALIVGLRIGQNATISIATHFRLPDTVLSAQTVSHGYVPITSRPFRPIKVHPSAMNAYA